MEMTDAEARRLVELERIAGRCRESVHVARRRPCDELPCLRAVLQWADYLVAILAAQGRPVPARLAERRAGWAARFARLAGRPFDPRRDAIGWEEADALPSYRPDCN